jgi:DNA repair exonuclease SbcCD nuclease subunit
LRDDFLIPLKERNIETHIIAGNHDTFYKNTNEVNALKELIDGKYDNIHTWCKDPVSWTFDGTPILLMPWICDENRSATMQAVKKSQAPIIMGHLELQGFEMHRGHVNEHGDDPRIFDKFDLVCSGHYHTRSNNGNIFYLGTPAQYTWTDYNDIKGFHILDTNTRSLEFIPNSYQSFHKFFYDDINKQMDEVLVFDAEQYKNCYVKVIVKNKTNPYWFDIVIERLEKANIADLQVVEDHFHLDLEADDDIVNEAEDTISIINKFIDGMNINTDRKRVENIIQNLYIEAHEIL